MRFTHDNTLIAVSNETKLVHRYQISDNYDLDQGEKIGHTNLKDPWDVAQLPDGRIAVCDGEEGHSVKVKVLLN